MWPKRKISKSYENLDFMHKLGMQIELPEFTGILCVRTFLQITFDLYIFMEMLFTCET